MYIMPTMIDMGLKNGQSWPSEAHKVVAQNLLLCNSLVTTRDTLTEGAPPIEHLHTIYEIQAPPEPREVSATREQTNPLSDNGFYMVVSDLQLFNAALTAWLKRQP